MKGVANVIYEMVVQPAATKRPHAPITQNVRCHFSVPLSQFFFRYVEKHIYKSFNIYFHRKLSLYFSPYFYSYVLA